MVFSSLTFLCVFLPVVYLLYLVIRQAFARNVLLVISSFIFYAYGEPVYVLLMLASTVMNWGAGRLIGNTRNILRKRAVLTAAVLVNLGMLGVFKYTDMVIGTLNTLFVMNFPLTGIELPIGISFYTFQAMSYVIDVYRGEAPSQKSLLNVALYISFFPQLIAGPIVKYHDIEQQLKSRRLTPLSTARGVSRFAVGLGKKVLIANTVAICADSLYALPTESLNAGSAWLAAAAYMIQIYFDFGGYSDMAIGMGYMFGFRFPENFDYPYSALSMKDFWRRWHISLTTWFREYLYIPLGGNRRGRARTAINKIIVFFTTGLWHGPSWTYVVWGLFNGAFLLFEDAVPVKRLPKPAARIYTLVTVCVAFVLFRAETLAQGFSMIGIMFSGGTFTHESMSFLLSQLTPGFITAMAAGILFSFPVVPILAGHARRRKSTRKWTFGLGYLLSLCILVLCMLTLSSATYNPFIYFRF